jgi:hypothetical protein
LISPSKISIKSPKLAGYQKDILHSDARFTITEAGTKTGKTFSHIYWLFRQAHEYRVGEGHNYWWVAPVYQQAKIAYNRMWRKVVASGMYRTNKSELTITTPLGTIIQFKTADNPDNLYGEDVYSAVFDEFTRAKQESWWALRSTLTATKAPCKLIGNFKGTSNWGHQLSLKAQTDPEYEYFRITAWDAVNAGILDREEVEQAQRDLPLFMFKALYLAEGDIDKARLITDEAISNLFTNTFVKEGKVCITADIAAYGSDYFVLFVWSGFKIIDALIIDAPEEKAPDKIEAHIRRLAEQHKVPMSNIVYDADGLGVFLKGYLKGARAFHNGGTPIKQQGHKMDYINLKSQCYFAMAERMNNNEYHIACDLSKYKQQIVEDLEAVKNRTLGMDGKVAVLKKQEIKEIIGRSPDFSDAMMMRELLELRTFGWLENI